MRLSRTHHRRVVYPLTPQPAKSLHRREELVMGIIYIGALYAGFCGVICLMVGIDLIHQYTNARIKQRAEARANARAYFVATINIV